MDVAQIKEELKSLEGWIFLEEKNTIHKEFIFKSYLKNISFVNAVAWLANKHNHHPDLFVSFNKCIVTLTTHDEKNVVTEKDITLARSINEL